jgi:OTU domain-containing protein 3
MHKKKKRKQREDRKRFIQEKKKRQYGDAEWKSDFLKFSDQLVAIGLMIKDVAGDGNCLFRAMADQFTGEPNNHATYRKQICDYIFYNRQDFEPFIEDDEPFDAYLTRMRRNATWGGHLEIQACSMLYQVNITIHQLNQPRWDLSFPGIAMKTIHFSYHQGQHYSSVRMIGDNGGPPHAIEIQTRGPKTISKSQKKEPEINIPREEELIIMEHTSCNNFEFIRQVLLENYGDIETSIEFIFVVGPDNLEFQQEYLDKPYDSHQKSNKPPENPKEEYKEKKTTPKE